MSDGTVKPENVLGVVSEIVSIAKDNPDARAAGADLAKSIAVVSRLVKNALLPLAAANYGIEKAAAYFQSKVFKDELAAKTSHIPDERLIAPHPYIAGPVLQSLAYSFEEADLKDMYLELLAHAMDSDTAEMVHPAFAEIIKQLSAREVPILTSALKEERVPMARLVYQVQDGEGKLPALRHLADLANDDVRLEDILFPQYVDNWVRLGLVDVSYDEALLRPGTYDWDVRLGAITSRVRGVAGRGPRWLQASL